jgi:hypothetical protein
MKIVINAKKGESVNHFMFGAGTIVEITDKYIAIDFQDKKNWKAAISPSDKITINGTNLIQWSYDEQVANYEVSFEYIATDYSLTGAVPVIKNTLTELNVSESAAVNLIEKRVSAYKNYQGGFWITKIVKY